MVNYFIEELGFVHYSASAYLTQLIREKGEEVNRDTMRAMANSLRERFGPSHVIEQLYLQAKTVGKDAVIESVRTLGEVEKMRENPDFILLSVDADQQLRYQRALLRKSEKDAITREKFQEQEALEAENKDLTKANITACQQLADRHLYNNGNIKELYDQLRKLPV